MIKIKYTISLINPRLTYAEPRIKIKEAHIINQKLDPKMTPT